MISTVVLLAGLLLGAWLTLRYASYRKFVNQINGPPVESILGGNLNLFLRGSHLSMKQYTIKIYQLLLHYCEVYRNDGAFRLWFGPFHTLFVLTNAHSVEKLLNSSVNLNKGHEYKFMAPWLGDGLLLADSSVWRSRRKLLTPAFHFKILENFIPIFARHTRILLHQIEQHSRLSIESEGNSSAQTPTRNVAIDDVRPLFEDLTLNIINETSMGIDYDKIDANSDQNESYRAAMKYAFRGASSRANNPLYWIDSVYRHTRPGKIFYKYVQIMLQYTDNIINKRMGDFKDKVDLSEGGETKKETIFLDILLEKYFDKSNQDKQLINPQSMRSEVNTFILGGHDTTAMALTFTVLMVGLNSEVQNKIYEELDAIFAGDPRQEMDMEDLRQMRYLEMCIKETLRLYPSIQMVGRQLTESLTLPNGNIIPANSTCYVPILSIHQDPDIYPNPKQFNPERFAPENLLSTGISPYAYIPFSAGPRNCIGQKYAMLELKYVLADLFRHFRVTSLTDPKEIVKELTPVIKPLTKIKVLFEPI